MKIPERIHKQTEQFCNLLEFAANFFFTFFSMLIFGICGYLFSELFKMSTFWMIVVTLLSSIFITLYLKWKIRSIYNHVYINIKKYIPKKKRKIRDKTNN